MVSQTELPLGLVRHAARTAAAVRHAARNADYAADRQAWATPPRLFRGLQDKFGGFRLDAAADKLNRLCADYIPRHLDGAVQPWVSLDGSPAHTWCNPPFAQGDRFARHAASELLERGVPSLLLVLASFNSQWFCDVAPHARVWTFRGRVEFIPPPDVDASNNNRDCMLLEFDPHKEGGKLCGILNPVDGRELVRLCP